MKLSIVLPVYNAEKYIRRCVDSILSQTLQDLELLIVDDGSKDSSGLICDEYAKKNQRVRVIHQQNAGVSAARNAGINASTGEYIGFVDSDDWVEPEMFERLLSEAKATGADVVMCDATTVYSSGKTQADTITQLSGNRILEKSDFTPSLLLEMAGSAWRCIYKNDRYSAKLRKYPLAFPLGVKFSEDRVFNLYAFGQADRVAYIKEAYYNRYMNVESAVHRFHKDYFEACKRAANGVELAIQCVWDDKKQLQEAYLGQLIVGAFGAICNYYYKTSTLTKQERRKAVERLCEDQQLCTAIEHYGADRKSKWILSRNYRALIAYARLANWKHRR